MRKSRLRAPLPPPRAAGGRIRKELAIALATAVVLGGVAFARSSGAPARAKATRSAPADETTVEVGRSSPAGRGASRSSDDDRAPPGAAIAVQQAPATGHDQGPAGVQADSVIGRLVDPSTGTRSAELAAAAPAAPPAAESAPPPATETTFSADRVRELEGAVASQPPEPHLVARAQTLVDSVRRMPGVLPGELGPEALQCGQGACKINVPEGIRAGVRLLLDQAGDHQGMVANEPRGANGPMTVYFLPTAQVAANDAPPAEHR